MEESVKIDAEIIKDFIMEKNPTTTRSNIIFENIYIASTSLDIICPYRADFIEVLKLRTLFTSVIIKRGMKMQT